VPATVRSGQRHRDVVVAAALLHPKVGTANRRRTGSLPQAGEPEEVPEQMPLCNDAEEPLSHCLEGSHLLDAVRVEVLELRPIHEQHSSDDQPAGTEKPRSWKAMNDTTYPLGGCGTDSPAGKDAGRRRRTCQPARPACENQQRGLLRRPARF
jgi:hypothetical protein